MISPFLREQGRRKITGANADIGAVNYDMYPPKMVPGMHVIVHTSATNDRDARLLLMSMGIPFHGKLR